MKNNLLIILISCFLLGCSAGYKPSKSGLTGQDSVDKIVAAANEIDLASQEPVIATNTKVIRKEAGTVKSTISKLDNELAKAKASYYQMYQRWLTGIIIISGLLIGVSVALFIMGNLKSLTITIIALAVFVSAITMQFLSAYFVWIGAGAVLIICGILIYQVWIKKRSTTEIIQSIDKGVEQGIINLEEFGPIADKYQKKYTKKIVDDVQTLLRKKKT